MPPPIPTRAAILPLVATLLLGAPGIGCGRPPGPGPAVDLATANWRTPGEAIPALTDAIRHAPADPELRIALARWELADGSNEAAEGSLQRARSLGASADAVAVPLARSLLGQQKYDEALALIGDPSTRAPALRLPLAVVEAETLLRMTATDPRVTRRRFVAAWRLQEDATRQGVRADDLAVVEARLAELRATEPLVESAYQHYACGRAPPAPLPPPSTASLAGSPEARGRRLLQVGPARELRRPSEAARKARDGDIVEIDAGDYPGDVAVWTQSGITLRGVGGRAVLDSGGAVAAEQGIWVLRGNDVTVENVEFAGARAIHRNGSGIRFTGRNLTVRNCVFRDNEDGLLTWNDPESDILVEHSVFSRNGYGDGQSHNIYIGRVRSFTLRYSHSHDSHIGHAVKSRAALNRILYNRLTDEEDGDGSYLVDLPEGGVGYVTGNELLKGARADNPHAISYASERPDVAEGSLWVVNNTFYNRYPEATFVRNRSQRPVRVVNNVAVGAPVSLKAGAVELEANRQDVFHGLRDAPGLDFGLLPDSPLIDAGIDPDEAQGRSLLPEFEYLHPASGRPRQRVAAPDAGAREFCGW
jgi:hypothetical protein